MRDRRFIAKHRGGELDAERHRLLAAWAADCAERLLPLFELACPDKDQPRRAIAIARAWSRGEARTGDAMQAARLVHVTARTVTDDAARAAARACGHAVATGHAADHCLGVVVYGVKAIKASGRSPAAERAWQIEQLPADVRELVTSALAGERFALVV